jgi:DNA polymerase III delta prime subunit
LSEQTGIDVIRSQIKSFVSSASFDGKKKLVIGDEADRLSPQAMDSLKSFLETFSKNCSFIFISNHSSKITPELHSRLQEIKFVFPKEEKRELMIEFIKSISKNLKNENVDFEPKAIAKVVQTFFPDLRKTWVELQNLSQQYEKLSLDVVSNASSYDIDEFFRYIAKRDFGKLNQYVTNMSGNLKTIYPAIFDNVKNYVKSDDWPQSISIIQKYHYESAFCVDDRIPVVALGYALMTECEWKEV